MTTTLHADAPDAPAVDVIEPFTPPDRDPRWAELAAPFPADEIEWKPQPLVKRGDPNANSYQCDEKHKDRDGRWCGGYHVMPAIHIAYVGHAGITKRLNDVVSPDGWSWEFAHRQLDRDVLLAAIQSGDREIVRMVMDNAPPLYQTGGLWIKLTVLGHTRYGFGDANGGQLDPKAVKEIIGDAIRNGAMRFGVGLYLWGKSDSARALQNVSGVNASGPVRVAPEAQQEQEPIGRGEQPRQPQRDQRPQRPAERSYQVPPAARVRPDPVTGEPMDAAARAIEERRRQDHDRYRGNGQQNGQQNGQRNGQAPPARPRDQLEVADLLDGILRETRQDRLTGDSAHWWTQGRQITPAGLHTDVASALSPDARRILAALGAEPAGPIKLGRVLVTAAKHLDAEGGMSIHDHIELEAAPIGPDGTPIVPQAGD